MAGKKALVTGVCGFCGSHMVEILAEDDWEIRATDLENADRERLKELGVDLDKLGVEFIPSDHTDKESLKKVLKGIEYVFNPASVFDFLAPWDVHERVNIQGMRNICEAALEEGVKSFVHWSTAGVYGQPEPEYIPTSEDAPKNPSNIYEKAKCAQEEIGMEFFEKEKMPIIIIRPAPIYGPRNKYGVFDIIKLVAGGKAPILPISAKRHLSPFCHVRDICGAALYLSTLDDAFGEAFNVVDDSVLTYYDVVHLVANLCGDVVVYDVAFVDINRVKPLAPLVGWWSRWEAKYITHKRPKIEEDTVRYVANNYSFSNIKLKNTDYKLKYPYFQVGLRETMEWYKRRGWI